MNAAEIKLDLFRRIDNLSENDLEKMYDKFLTLLSSTSTYTLSDLEKEAIRESLSDSKKGNVFSHEDVVNEAKERYPNLRFK